MGQVSAYMARTVIDDNVKRTSGLLFDYLVEEANVGLVTNIQASCSKRVNFMQMHSI